MWHVKIKLKLGMEFFLGHMPVWLSKAYYLSRNFYKWKRGGGKRQLRSKILQQKEKCSCAFLSRKPFYFRVQRVAYFAAFWLCILSFSHLADTRSLCASLTFSPCKLLPSPIASEILCVPHSPHSQACRSPFLLAQDLQ